MSNLKIYEINLIINEMQKLSNLTLNPNYMTALVFTLQQEQVYISMDTLVVNSIDKKPMSFQRKFLSLPESDLVIAGTGLVNLINGWFKYISSFSDLGDIDDLNRVAPGILQESVKESGG